MESTISLSGIPLFGRFGSDGGGLLEAHSQLYRYSNAVNNHAQGDLLINNPVRLTFSPSAQAIGERAYLESDADGFSQAEKNFAIGEQLGFLIQPPVIDRIIEVTTFDPKTMAKLPARSSISEADKERNPPVHPREDSCSIRSAAPPPRPWG